MTTAKLGVNRLYLFPIAHELARDTDIAATELIIYPLLM